MDNINNENEYYKAYEKRYKQVYDNNMLWSTKLPTPEVINFIDNYKVKKDEKILDLGCGEGRDSIYLLDNGYNVLALDYSKSVIDMCNKLSNYKYKESFKQFDIMEDTLNEKFNYIYSVAVFHMFVLKEHRDNYLTFIKNHLTDNGYCLITILGDGKQSFSSDIKDAFNNTKRIVMNNNKELELATTSCKIVNWEELENEIASNDLLIEKKWISKDVPEFNNSMCVIVKKR